MVLLAESYGNHSNRLFQSLHYEAFCLEYGIEYRNLTMNDLTGVFPGIRPQTSQTWSQRLVYGLSRRGWTKIHRPHTQEELKSFDLGKNLLVGGWAFRCNDLTWKHREALKARYEVSGWNSDETALRDKLRGWKKAGSAVVGVHIRRGDYREFEGGRYFYEDDVYLRHMKSVRSLLAQELRPVCFVIFSNEPSNLETDESCEFSRSRWQNDHVLMAECDYLLGPPSTFTLWASYTGNTPCYHIVEPQAPFRLADFEVCHG